MLQQINSHLVEIDALVNEPYSAIIGYPRCSSDELENRIKELKAHTIDAILFEGDSKIGRFDVLGKGCVSVVTKAVSNNKVVALKIRRTDADRSSMDNEARLLKIANNVDVGPSFISNSKNFLLMEYVNGTNIFKFIETENGKERVSNVISEILEQCYELDRIGLDHGELSNMKKHVIVGGKVTIIDFESASVNRRMMNVTAASQYLLVGGALANKVRKLLNIDSIDSVISLLREYKNDPRKENLEHLQQIL